MAGAKKGTGKGTKVPTKKGFDEIQIEATTTISPMAAKEAELESERIEGIRKRIGGQNLESVVQDLTKTGLDLSGIVQGLVPKLQAAWNQLDELRAMQDAEATELERLYSVGTIKSTIAELVAEHEQLVTAHNKQITEIRADWMAREATWEKTFSEQQAMATEKHVRDEREYVYKVEQLRRAETDGYNEDIRNRNAAERDRREILDKSWLERENKLKFAEQELTDLRTKFATFDSEVKKAGDVSFKIGHNTATKDLESKFALEKAGFDKEQALANAKVMQLTTENQNQQTQIIALQTKVDQAHAKIAEMTSQAFASVSDRKAYEAAQTFQNNGNNGQQGTKGPRA